MKLRIILAACAAQLLTLTAHSSDEFESPPSESPAASLSKEEVSGESFHVVDPVQSDGLMHHYVLESRFGTFPAYGRDALRVRLQEIAALNRIADTPKAEVVVKSLIRAATPDAPSLALLATHPLSSVTGIPLGISHLFWGYLAQAKEVTEQARETRENVAQEGSDPGSAGHKESPESKVASGAVRYAQRYLGITDAERRWYQKLGVDPYTTNEVLRRAVHRLARLDAGASLPLHFASLPRMPYGQELDRTMDAIYTESPAVLRARRHAILKDYGLTAEEIRRFEHNLLLSPTSQTALVEIAKALSGVEGRGELFRHAMTVTSEEEVSVFLHSAALLPALHAQRPLTQILPGVRVPAAKLADGRVLLVGAFDSIYWTQDVAGYEGALHQALPGDAVREIWLTGAVSPRARAELTQRGWDVHDQAAALLGGKRSST